MADCPEFGQFGECRVKYSSFLFNRDASTLDRCRQPGVGKSIAEQVQIALPIIQGVLFEGYFERGLSISTSYPAAFHLAFPIVEIRHCLTGENAVTAG